MIYPSKVKIKTRFEEARRVIVIDTYYIDSMGSEMDDGSIHEGLKSVLLTLAVQYLFTALDELKGFAWNSKSAAVVDRHTFMLNDFFNNKIINRRVFSDTKNLVIFESVYRLCGYEGVKEFLKAKYPVVVNEFDDMIERIK